MMLWALLLFVLIPQSVFAQAIPVTIGWHALTGTTIRSVCAGDETTPVNYSSLKRTEGCNAITHDWNSAIWDSQNNRMIVWGAGHDGYWGNEVYQIVLDPNNVIAPRISRLNNPALPSSTCTNTNTGTTNGQDGTPTGRHTQDQIVYIAHAQVMYNKGGPYNCASGGIGQGAWTLNLNSLPTTCDAKLDYPNVCQAAWTSKSSTNESNTSGATYAMDYDPNTKLVWIQSDNANLYSYNYDTDTWTQRAGHSFGSSYRRTGIVIPDRRLFVVIGNSQVVVWDLNRQTPTSSVWTTTGDTAMVSKNAPALAYDQNTRTLLAWSQGNSVYRLNLETRAWTQETYSGGPPACNPPVCVNGDYKRMRYVPPLNGFLVVNDVDDPAYFLRTSTTITSTQDFVNRCSQPGVVRCFGFDHQNELSPNSCTQAGCWSTQPYGWFAGQATISLDTNIKASGDSALRLDIASGQNGNAAFFGNFSNDYSQLFGANQTIYFSFRQYMGPGYKEPYNDSSNAKQAFLSTGSIGTGVSNSATSCTNLEILFESFYGVLGHYKHSPPTNNWQQPSGGTTLLQNARTGTGCKHNQTPPGGGAADGSDMFPPNGNCWAYHEQEWMSFKLRLDIGSGPTGGFWIGSRGRTWAAYDGQPWEAIVDWQFGVTTATQHASGGASEPAGGTNSKYGQIWLTARNDTSWATAPVYTLYDEVIISTQDIAAPGQSSSPAPAFIPVTTSGKFSGAGKVTFQ